MEGGATEGSAGGSPFPPTHWSIVLGSGASDPARAQQALERLCELYRGPIIKWYRRYTRNQQDAEDLAHDFVGHLLEKGLLSRVTGRKGKFRSFLVVCMRNYLHDARDWAKAQKRGGGEIPLSLAEGWDLAAEKDLDSRLDVDLSLDIHERVMGSLAVPKELHPYLCAKDTATRWETVADGMHTNAAALRQRVRRLRQDHWQAFAKEAAMLVSPGEEADETQYLYELLFRNLPPETTASVSGSA